MTTRDLQLLDIRPIINTIKISDNMSKGERFQNVTLRPIIKLQNDLLVAVFRNYTAKHKNVFYELTIDKRLHYIDNAIHKDIKLRNSLKGMIIGQFTTEEYSLYIENSSALNKRMMNLVIQRLQSNIQLFEKTETLISI
ncbi:glyoxalase [uncultured Lacinutrix sp.]|uniref:glyoxalase n=1 Tax=uncultured Lacinutrix sp. TaxID=574032 RepID=UPI0026121C92|nr:glyoxalase [uncultured Lacinutrix sp.]